MWMGALYFIQGALPGDGEPLLRNEGVGIVLDQRATAAWKNASETWEAISSRIVTA